MGLVYVTIALRNPIEPDLKPIEVKALVDTGAVTLCIPQWIATQLKLPVKSSRKVIIADGKSVEAPYVGPVEVRFGDRFSFTGALVVGGETVLLGAVPLEDMDLVIDPRSQNVTVNPDSPDIPSAIVMRADS